MAYSRRVARDENDRDELETFRRFLKERGHKLTLQREAIVRRIQRIDKHFSAEELFEVLRGENKSTSKATVYRTLALLVEANLLDALDFERGHLLYERAKSEAHHDHLICIACKRIFEFRNEEIERLQEQVARRHDFEMVSHTHQIYGVCSRCKNRGISSEDAQQPTARRVPRVSSSS